MGRHLNQVKLEGAGVRVEMRVNAQNVHATGDVLILGELLGGPLALGLKQIVQQAFQKKLRYGDLGTATVLPLS